LSLPLIGEPFVFFVLRIKCCEFFGRSVCVVENVGKLAEVRQLACDDGGVFLEALK